MPQEGFNTPNTRQTQWIFVSAKKVSLSRRQYQSQKQTTEDDPKTHTTAARKVKEIS